MHVNLIWLPLRSVNAISETLWVFLWLAVGAVSALGCELEEKVR